MATGLPRLHTAAREGDITAINRVLEDGEDVIAANEFGDKPLHLAVWKYGKSLELVSGCCSSQERETHPTPSHPDISPAFRGDAHSEPQA